MTIWSEGERELWPPYRRVEMSLASGRAVAVSTAMDPDTMMPRYARGGARSSTPRPARRVATEPIAPRREFTDPDEWRAAADGAARAALLTT